MNLSAMREEITEWWAVAVRRGHKEVKLVLLAQTARISIDGSGGSAPENGGKIALAGSTTGAAYCT